VHRVALAAVLVAVVVLMVSPVFAEAYGYYYPPQGNYPGIISINGLTYQFYPPKGNYPGMIGPAGLWSDPSYWYSLYELQQLVDFANRRVSQHQYEMFKQWDDRWYDTMLRLNTYPGYWCGW